MPERISIPKEVYDHVENTKARLDFNRRLTELSVQRFLESRAIDHEVAAQISRLLLTVIEEAVNPEIATVVHSRDVRAGHERDQSENKGDPARDDDKIRVLIRELVRELLDYAPTCISPNRWVNVKVNGVLRVIQDHQRKFVRSL